MEGKKRNEVSALAEDTLLVAVIDCNPYVWGSLGDKNKDEGSISKHMTFAQCADAVMVFLNAYMMMSQNHSVAVVASHASGSTLIYPEEVPGLNEAVGERVHTISHFDGQQCHFADINSIIVQNLKRLSNLTPNASDEKAAPGYSMLSAALARSLCFINKVKLNVPVGRNVEARILVINASPDYAAQYMSVMNCIFAAVKNKVTIDACVLNGEESSSGFLQQATEISGGLHTSLKMTDALLQYLLTFYLPNKDEREVMRLPRQTDVDYRAACFCHNKVISIGYVCSVCLSVFCEVKGVCSTCHTRFKPRIQRATRK
eukprot:CFRG7790T1